MVDHLTPTDRTRVRRLPEKQVDDVAAAYAVLDAGLVAHVGIAEPSAEGEPAQPYVVPVGYARHGDAVVFHGSTGSRLFRSLAAGAPTCLTVTLLDGLVVARSLFESSMRYRCVMVLGRCEPLSGDEAAAALDVIADHLMPGRRTDARPASRKELAATQVLRLPLDELSLKVSAGWPDDAPEDVDLPVWAGVVPLWETYGEPVDAPDLAPGRAVPDYVRGWRR